MAFTATIEGIEQLKQDLSGWKLKKELVTAIGQTARELHSLLRTQVNKTYNTGGRNINSVLVGSTSSNLKMGFGFIESGLVYEGGKLPLSTFPRQAIATSKVTSFIAPNAFTPLLRGKIKRVKPVEATALRIRKDKLTFIQGGFKGKVKGKTRILRRDNYFSGGRTWLELPTRQNLVGKRSPYYEMYGIGLVDMIAVVYNENPYIQDFKNDFATRVSSRLKL